MKQKRNIFMIFSLVAFISFRASADTIPGIPAVGQEENHWCWAAAIQSITKYYNPQNSKSQTEIAGVITTQDSAPPVEDLKRCLELNNTDVKLKVEMVNDPLPWEKMKEQGDNKHPFLFLIRWNSGGYHNNVYCGYISESRIKFMDPGHGGSFVYRSYDGCMNINNRGTWERSFLTSLPTALKKTNNSFSDNTSSFKIITNTMSTGNSPVSFVLNNAMSSNGIFRIYNALGACVFQTVLSNETNRISMDKSYSIPSGMYYATLELPMPEGNSITERKQFSLVK